MNIKELRIGNYVTEEVSQTTEVSSIFKDGKLELMVDTLKADKTIDKICYTVDGSYVNPIVLDEDILVKFGFVEDERTTCYYLGDFMVRWYGNSFTNWYIRLGEFDVPFVVSKKIEYVHQLQNLYFTLTGKELKLNTKNDTEGIFDKQIKESQIERFSIEDAKEMVKAWESLPEGNYSPKVISNWLMNDMKPVIDKFRAKIDK